MAETGTERADHRQGEDEGRQPEQQVDQAADTGIEDPAEEARRGTDRDRAATRSISCSAQGRVVVALSSAL